MNLILASSLNNSKKDELGNWYAIALPNKYQFLPNIKKYISKYESVVFVANDPSDYEVTDEYANLFFSFIDLSNLKFDKKIILDNRNKDKAKEIIENADLIFLSGDSVYNQQAFLKKLN